MRAEHQVDKRVSRFQTFGHARLLRHAAAHADEQLRPLLFQFLEPDDVAQGAVFRVFAHAAGVVEDEAGLLPLAFRAQAHLREHAGDGFRIAFVHLAAHGDDVEAFRAAGHFAHARCKATLALQLAFRNKKAFVHGVSSVHSFKSFAPLGGVSDANGSSRYSVSPARSSASTRTAPAFGGAPSFRTIPATGGEATSK